MENMAAAIVVLGLALFAASTPNPTSPASGSQPEKVAASSPSSNSSPTESDVQAKIQEVFGGAVTITKGTDAGVVVGDFNGDHSQDLAVVVRPVPDQLEKLNSVYANWLVEDPRALTMPEMANAGLAAFPQSPKRVPIRSTDLLLAIIHGHGKEGWRSGLTTQFFLLQNSVGQGMKVEDYQSASSSIVKRGGLPQLRGDVIHETLDGKPGILYRFGGLYLWFQ